MTFSDSPCQLLSIRPQSKNVIIYVQSGKYEEHLVLDASLVDIDALEEELAEEEYEYLHSLILSDDDDDDMGVADGEAVIRQFNEPAFYRENIVKVIYHRVSDL